MKTLKNITLVGLCASLISCAGADAWMIKNTGLSTTDAILLGVNTKNRVELTLKEFNDAKNRNLPSGKEVVVVSPQPVELQPTVLIDPDTGKPEVKKESWIDSLWNLF
jgi:hypothetical protein